MRLALLFALVSYCYCQHTHHQHQFATESPDESPEDEFDSTQSDEFDSTQSDEFDSTQSDEFDSTQSDEAGIGRAKGEICYLAKLAVQAKKEDIRHYNRERSFARRKARILCMRVRRKCYDKIEGILTSESNSACRKETNACFAKFGGGGKANKDKNQAAIKRLELQLLDRLIGQKRVCYGGYGGGGGEAGR